MIWKLEMIKEMVRAQNCVVEYIPYETICPVCRMAGMLPAEIQVTSTVKELRYCTCTQCDCCFRAVGEAKPQKAKKSVKSTDSTDKKLKVEHTEIKEVKKPKVKKTRKRKAKATKKVTKKAKKENNNE